MSLLDITCLAKMVESGRFQVDDTFFSYKEFKSHLKEFENVNFVQLTHRDSRTLNAACKRTAKIVEKANKELVY